MAFTFTAFTYILALILDAFLIFFSVFHVSCCRCWCCNTAIAAAPVIKPQSVRD